MGCFVSCLPRTFAVLGYQATWQMLGYTNPAFVKFMRRYNRRPNAAEKQ
jgi:hypothetical protein